MTNPVAAARLVASLACAASMLSGCTTALDDPDSETPGGGKADGSFVDPLGSARVAWSHPGNCKSLLADDESSVVLHCRDKQPQRHSLDILDAATGDVRWSVALPSSVAASVFTHGDRVWLWIASPDLRPHRRVYALFDGALESELAVPEIPVDVAWDAAGNRYELGVGSSADWMRHWGRIRSYDASDVQRWGGSQFSTGPFGITALFPSSDGNIYVAVRERFQALSSEGAFLWADTQGEVRSVFLAADGSPVVMTTVATTYYPTDAPVDLWGKKPRIGLGSNAVVRDTVVDGTPAFVTASNKDLVLRDERGNKLTTLVASNEPGGDGLAGPEFGLMPHAGSTGALIQTPTGVGFATYGTTAPAWSRPWFFLPVASGATGFVGLCTRPPERTADGPAMVADTVTFCGATEAGQMRWRATLPWANYGITSRALDWQQSAWQGETGTFVEAVAAKRWIISGLAGTYGIRTE